MKQEPTESIGAVPGPEQALRLLKSLRKQMPFLVALTARERRGHRRVDRRILSHLRLVMEAAQTHPTHLAKGFRLEAFTEQIEHIMTLHGCLTELESLTFDLRDTLRASVTEATREGQVVQSYLRTSSRTTPGLAMQVRRLSRRRPRRSRSRRSGLKPNPALLRPSGPISDAA